MKKHKTMAAVAFLLPLAACICYRWLLFPLTASVWGDLRAGFIETIVVRLLCSVSVAVLVHRAAYALFTRKKERVVHQAFGVCMLVALNNFPFSAYLSGRAHLTAGAEDVLLFAAVCLSVALFEELIFRGYLLSAMCRWFGPGRKSRFAAVLLSAAVFALFHLLNLLSGASPLAVVLQVGYSFLVGAMTGALFLLSGNILLPIAVHAVYNFGGLLLSELGQGDVRMDGATIVVTVVVALCATVVLSRLLWRQEE